ncbi:MAG: winged helix-turn-helix domain-containing protein [Candidatus Pelagibacterales bacterium]
MLQKSEKKICIKLKDITLKKIFTELIFYLNKEIKDVEFVLLSSSNLKLEFSNYFISDDESIIQLINDDLKQEIKKIYLISSKSHNIKTNIEIVNYNLPFRFLDFIDYIIGDLRQNFNKQEKIIFLKSLSYDVSSRRIFNDSISLILTEKENEIFYFLLESEMSVSKGVLLKNIWKYSEGIDTHTLETHIYSLRKKLEKKLKVKNILEHMGEGYFLNRDLL